MRNTLQPSQLPAGLLGNAARKQARAAPEVDETGGWIGVWLGMLPIALACRARQSPLRSREPWMPARDGQTSSFQVVAEKPRDRAIGASGNKAPGSERRRHRDRHRTPTDKCAALIGARSK